MAHTSKDEAKLGSAQNPIHALKDQEWGDGKSTAATPEGAAKLVADAAGAKNLVGFSGAKVRRRLGGPLGLLLDFLFGKDPNIFDPQGRIRHQFSEAKWKAWDDRLRASKDYDWKHHSGRDGANKGHK